MATVIGPSAPGYVQGTADTQFMSPSGNLPVGGYSTGPGTYANPQTQSSQFLPQTQSVLGASTGPSSSTQSIADAWRASGGQGDIPVGWNPSTASGPSQDQINQAINDTYNASNQYLDQAESQLNTDYPTIQGNINDEFTNNQNILNTQNSQNLGAFKTQSDTAAYNNENALAAARRLYSELNQGYQQRFGGSSSAGQAASEIANVEQQRQMGQDQRGYQQTLNQINTQQTNTEANFQNSLQSLLVQKNQALQQAQQDFQSKLLQITQNRAANEQAKGQAKLQALQDLRNQVFSINQQNTQFQQTLAAQRQQSQLQLQNYQALAGNGVNTGAAALGIYSNAGYMNPTSNLQAGGYSSGQSAQPNLVGAINSNRNQDLTGAVNYQQPDYLRYPTNGYTQ